MLGFWVGFVSVFAEFWVWEMRRGGCLGGWYLVVVFGLRGQGWRRVRRLGGVQKTKEQSKIFFGRGTIRFQKNAALGAELIGSTWSKQRRWRSPDSKRAVALGCLRYPNISCALANL